MLSKAKLGMLFGSMAAVLSLGVLGSAYAAEEQTATTSSAAQVQTENAKIGKVKMGFGTFFGKAAGVQENAELLALLKLDAEQLREELKAGKTLAEIAEAQGVAKQDVIDLLVKLEAEKLAKAVEAGKLTQEQADEKLAKQEELAAKIVEGAWEKKAFAEKAEDSEE